MNLLRSFLITVLLLGFLQDPVAAESFTAADSRLDDRAFLVSLDPGIRRARLIYKENDDAEGTVLSLVHLAGDEGFLKMRIPDDMAIERCFVEVSFEDPFPYEVYQSETTFSQTGNDVWGPRGPVSDFDNAPEAGGDGGDPETVQESDLWQWRGRTLYFFNQLRGLQVFDLAVPEDPKRIATLRLPSSGDQMYLIDDEHVLLITQSFNASHPWGHGFGAATSEALLIQHQGNSLRIQERFTFRGSYVESRLVGQRLYLVTQVYEPATEENQDWRQGLDVYGIDLTDPELPVQLPTLNLYDESAYFWSAVVSASPEYLIVAPSYYDQAAEMTRSRALLIPIGRDVETLEVSHTVELKAWLKDKFKLRVQDGILTTVTENNNWRDTLQTYVESFLLDPAEGERQKLDELVLAPQEQLHATRFDGDRLYVVTFFVELMKDPLFVIDLSDPANLKSLGELEIPGWSTYLEPMGDRLLSVGLEEGNVAVSLFDVADPSQPSLLKRVYPREGQAWSEATWDEKAIGFFPSEGLLLIPMQSWEENLVKNFVKLIDIHEDTLELRGEIDHEVQGRRTKAFDELIVSISGQELLVVNAEDRDEPAIVASLPLAWPADKVIVHGDYLYQFEEGQYWNMDSRIRLRISPSDDTENVLADVALGEGTLLGAEIEGGTLYLLSVIRRMEVKPDLTDEGGQLYISHADLVMETYDLSDPIAPVLLGEETWSEPRDGQWGDYEGRLMDDVHFVWAPTITRSQENGYYFWGDWGVMSDAAFGGLWWPYPAGSRWFDTAAIFVHNVSDLASPDLISRVELTRSNANAYGKSVFKGDRYFFSYQTHTYEGLIWSTHSFLETVDLTNPAEPVKSLPISVPGLLEGVHEAGGGTLLVTTSPDVPKDGDEFGYSEDQRLQASAFDGTAAYLVDELVIENGRYSTVATFEGYVFKPHVEGVGVYRWDLDEIAWTQEDTISLDHVPSALEVIDGRLFAQSGSSMDVIAIDQFPEIPLVEHYSFNGQTYGTRLDRIVLDPERANAWIPMGVYGVDTIDLSALGAEVTLTIAAQNAEEWLLLKGSDCQWVRASGDDYVGALVEEEEFRFRSLVDADELETWLNAHFNPAYDEGVTLPDAQEDHDRDGFSTLYEFAFNTHPNNPGAVPLIRPHLVTGPGEEKYLALELPQASRLDQFNVIPQVSEDLEAWQDAGESVEIDGVESLQLRFLESINGSKMHFLRIQLSLKD